MDVALVEDAEHDVDRHERAQNQDRFARQGVDESRGGALEGSFHRRRRRQVFLHFLDGRDGGSERSAGIQVEGEGGRRKLPHVADEDGRRDLGSLRDRAQGNGSTRGGF